MYFIMFEDATGFCLKVICSDEFSMLVSRFNVVAGKSDVSGPKNNIKQKKDKKHTHTHTRLCINLRLKEKEKKERILRVPLTSGAFPLIPRLMSPKLPFSFKYWLKRLHFLAKLDIWSGDLQEFCAKFAMDDENIQQMGCC
jgi:hypothetical protein